MTRLRALALAGAAALALAVGAAQQGSAATAARSSSSNSSNNSNTWRVNAQAFLHAYAQPNGQVIRHNDGNDTVSEGQAYALVLAQATHENSVFARIWRWTATHLQQPSGLLAWQANAAGQVESTQPASDADVITTWALSRTTGPGSARYHAVARRMAKAILANEVVKHGPALLAAGPWATGSPASLDPSYWTPAIFNWLAKFTGNQRWARLAANATTYTEHLTNNGRLLPPDWAHLEGSDAIANPAPNRTAPSIQYGLDAQRLTIWMATSCQAADRKLAASWWKLLAPQGHAGAQALSPSGAVISSQTNALGYIAAAAAAQAAGHPRAVSQLLADAANAQHSDPNYYGGAWLALGEALLTSNALGGCR